MTYESVLSVGIRVAFIVFIAIIGLAVLFKFGYKLWLWIKPKKNEEKNEVSK